MFNFCFLKRTQESSTLFSWVSHPGVADSLRPHGLQHARLPCPSPTPRAYSNSCQSSQWYHLIISTLSDNLKIQHNLISCSNHAIHQILSSVQLLIHFRHLWPRGLQKHRLPSDQIRSVAQSCPTLWDPMNCSLPGFPVHHQLPEISQTHD